MPYLTRAALFTLVLLLATVALAEQPARRTPVARGEELVGILGCHDCHTPMKMGANGPEPDMSRMLSGHPESVKLPPPPKLEGPWNVVTTMTAWSGPWGVSYTTNLTPDESTGIGGGAWSEELFVRAMRTGKHFGTSRPILPPMPWQSLALLPDEDLKAIWAYLLTIPPIVNHVPDPEPAAPAPAPTAPSAPGK